MLRAIAALLLFAAPLPAADKYYVVVMAYDTPSPLPLHTHTFAVFVADDGKTAKATTISWGPVSPAPPILCNVPGKNSTLPDTLKRAKAIGATVTRWPVLEVPHWFYAAGVARAAALDAGLYDYRAVNVVFRGRATNCIHAVSDVAGRRWTAPAVGECASDLVWRQFRRAALGLGDEGVVKRIGVGEKGVP